MKNPVARRLSAALAMLALIVPAYAFDLPRGAGFTVLDESGSVIAVGEVDDGRLELEVAPGAAGFGTLELTLPGGERETYDVLFSGSGELLVVVDDQIVSLSELAERAGLTLESRTDDDPARSRGGDDGRGDDDDRDDRGDDRDDRDDDRDDDDRDDDDRDDDDVRDDDDDDDRDDD